MRLLAWIFPIAAFQSLVLLLSLRSYLLTVSSLVMMFNSNLLNKHCFLILSSVARIGGSGGRGVVIQMEESSRDLLTAKSGTLLSVDGNAHALGFRFLRRFL